MKLFGHSYLLRLSCILLLDLLIVYFANGQGVGVNQTSPVSMLDVNGGVTIGSTYSGTNAAPANGMIVEGNVGIGTTAPSDFFHVYGGLSGNGITVESTSGAGLSIDRGANGNHYRLRFLTGGTEAWTIGNEGKSNDNLEFYEGSSSTASVVFEEGGFVGIGVTNPASILQTSYTESTTSGSLYPGIRSSITISGTPTADRTVLVNYNVTTNTAATSAFNNNVYGKYNRITNNNGAEHNVAYAIYNQYVNQDQSTLANTAGGAYNYVLNNDVGTLTNARGALDQVINNTTGTITNGYGNYALVRNDDGTLSNARGYNAYVYQNVAGGTINNAYGLYSRVRQVNGTINTGYGAYILMQGTIGTSYGTYVTGEDQNYYSGKVGIGVASPSELLHLQGTGSAKVFIEADTDNATETDHPQVVLSQDGGSVTGFMGFGNGTNHLQFSNDWANADADIDFMTQATTRMTIDGNGNVGIGTTAPVQLLDVNGNLQFTGNNRYLYFSDASGSGPSGIRFHGELDLIYRTSPNQLIVEDASDGGDIFSLDVDDDEAYFAGNVGIKQASPSYTLHVTGTVKSNGITESSDIRLKKNITPIENALDKVTELEGVYFKWRTGEFPEQNFDSTMQIGLIAQEVEQVLPEVVNTDKEGYRSVEYSKLVALLIQALKEQQEKIDELEDKVEVLAPEESESLEKEDNTKASY